MLRDSAFKSFDPPPSPATKALVVDETVPGDFPPLCRIAALASFLFIVVRVPVTTTVIPLSSSAFSGDTGEEAARRLTSACLSLERSCWLCSWRNHSCIDTAMTGPSPSTVSKSSIVACSRPSRSVNDCATRSATVVPTCGMRKPKRSRPRGWVFDIWMAVFKLLIEVSPNPSNVATVSMSRVKMSATSEMSFLETNKSTVCSPKPSMSMAPRDTKWVILPLTCAGQA